MDSQKGKYDGRILDGENYGVKSSLVIKDVGLSYQRLIFFITLTR